MTEFILSIKLDNKEMQTSGDVERAIRRSVNVCMLKEGHGGQVRDLNGNPVGNWQVR